MVYWERCLRLEKVNTTRIFKNGRKEDPGQPYLSLWEQDEATNPGNHF